jgi:integrase
MATIRKRGQRWFAEVRRQGAPSQRKSFGTKGQATKWARKVEADIDSGSFVPEAGKHTIRDLMERYRRHSRGKTRPAEREKVTQFWIERLGDYRLSNVSRAMVIEIRDELAEKLSTARVNRILSPLTHAFKLAATDWQWLDRTPLAKINLKEPRGRVRYLSDEERKAFLKAAAEIEDDRFYCYLMIALTTGTRRGEILSLRWQDVNLGKGTATLEETKNTDRRTIYLVPEVVDRLRSIRLVRSLSSDEVFADPNMGIVRKQKLENQWRAFRAGLDLQDFRYHDLRHSFASNMAMGGASLAEIAAALGHRQLSMVQRYAHLSMEHTLDAAKATALKMLQ